MAYYDGVGSVTKNYAIIKRKISLINEDKCNLFSGSNSICSIAKWVGVVPRLPALCCQVCKIFGDEMKQLCVVYCASARRTMSTRGHSPAICRKFYKVYELHREVYINFHDLGRPCDKRRNCLRFVYVQLLFNYFNIHKPLFAFYASAHQQWVCSGVSGATTKTFLFNTDEYKSRKSKMFWSWTLISNPGKHRIHPFSVGFQKKASPGETSIQLLNM